MKILIVKEQKVRKEISVAAIASFVCGLISFFIIPIIPAIVFGHVALSNIKKQKFSGKFFAAFGLVFGYVFLVFYILFSVVLYISLNSPSYQATPSKQLVSIQKKIQETNWPERKTVYNRAKINLDKAQYKLPEKKLYDKFLDVDISVNREDRGNFVYGVGTAGLKYLVKESGIDDQMPKYTIGSKALTKMIEDAGYTPKTNYSIAGKDGLIDYFWKTIQ